MRNDLPFLFHWPSFADDSQQRAIDYEVFRSALALHREQSRHLCELADEMRWHSRRVCEHCQFFRDETQAIRAWAEMYRSGPPDPATFPIPLRK